MKPIIRACSAGVLAVALVGAAGTTSAFAATEAVTTPGLLAAPTGLTPDNSTTIPPHAVIKNVKLNWAPVAGATGYRVEVGRDSTWSDVPILTKDVLFSEWTVPVGLPNANYVWRVAARKGSGIGHWSSEVGQAHSEASFTKGWRAAPLLNSVASPFTGEPTFSWSPVADAAGYELQASKDPYFAAGSTTGPTPDTSPSPTPQSLDNQNLAECFTGRTRYTPASDIVGQSDTVGACLFADPNPGDTVYWRVRALDPYATGTVISPTTPQTESITDTTPRPDLTPLRDSVAGSWSGVGSFVYSPSAVAGGPLPLVATTTLASEPDGLCAVTNSGAPEAEHARCRDIPTIRWADAGAVRYRLTLALDDAFTNVQYVVETPALQWTMPGALAESSADGSWYYVVQACDSDVCGQVTTTPPSFSKITPRLSVGGAPPVMGEMTLQWQSYAAALSLATGQAQTQDAYAYHLQVAHADDPYYSALVDQALVDETYFTPLKSYGDGDFRWRVQAVDNHGNALPWSLSQTFTRDATPPKVLSVSPSSSVAVTQPLKVTFSEPVTGVSAASLGLSPAVAHTVTVTSPTTATITPTAAMVPGATYRVVLTSAVQDLVGNAADPLGPTLTVKGVIDDKSKAFAYGGSWRLLTSSSALGGTYHGSLPTPSAQTTATTKFYGTGVYIDVCYGPANGYLDIYGDNVKLLRVSLYRSYTGCGARVAKLYNGTRGVHTLKLVGIGAHPSASKGNAVAIDSVTVIP